jgi:hypothetical protein
MNEQQWLSCTDPNAMLDFLHGKAGDRELRLFAAACCRKLFHPFQGERHRRAVGSAERYADGQLTDDELGRAFGEWSDLPWGRLPGREQCEVRAIRGALLLSAADGARLAGLAVAEVGASPDGLLRDLFGPLPFRPVTVSPAWQTPQVVALTQAAYDQRELPAGTLDLARLAILADALEDAGCDQADLLGHLRGPGPHVRGCWALDLLLGRD